jgi:hypothetical protein
MNKNELSDAVVRPTTMSGKTMTAVTPAVARIQTVPCAGAPTIDQHERLEPTIVPTQRSLDQGKQATSKRAQQLISMQLLTEKQVSAITAVPMGTLRRWRCVGDGPPFIKMGNGPKARVRYDAVDILAYVEAGKRYPIRAGNTGGQHGN